MGRVEVGGVGIEYEVAGAGRPVLLLHGFPDSGRLWRYQVPALAGAGFRVIIPDLRGYGRSDKPGPVDAYSLPLLAGDVLAILTELEIGQAHVVGHDSGAALAWGLAALSPGSVDHLVTLSVGNPVTFLRTLEQRQKSWYMLLFQFPGIAERWLTENLRADINVVGYLARKPEGAECAEASPWKILETWPNSGCLRSWPRTGATALCCCPRSGTNGARAVSASSRAAAT